MAVFTDFIWVAEGLVGVVALLEGVLLFSKAICPQPTGRDSTFIHVITKDRCTSDPFTLPRNDTCTQCSYGKVDSWENVGNLGWLLRDILSFSY